MNERENVMGIIGVLEKMSLVNSEGEKLVFGGFDDNGNIVLIEEDGE
jgi:hypothetical protein